MRRKRLLLLLLTALFAAAGLWALLPGTTGRRGPTEAGGQARRLPTTDEAGGAALHGRVVEGAGVRDADAGSGVAESATPSSPASVDTGVRGRVVDGAGDPIGGATVTVQDVFRTNPPAAATTDAKGRYEVASAPSMAVAVRARAAGHGPAMQSADVVDGRVTELADLVLPEEAVVRGRVLDERGHPVGGATVTWALVSHLFVVAGEGDAAVTRTGPDGSFRLGDLPEGAVEIRVSAKGFANARFPSAKTEPGRVTKGIEIRLAPEAPLRLSVIDEGGKPVSGVSITPWGEKEAYAVDEVSPGHYVAHGLPPGPLRMDVWAPDRAKETVEATAGAPEVTVPLRRLATALVALRDADTSAPLEPKALFSEKGIFRDTDEVGPGTWRVHGLEWGKNRIRANVEGYGVAESEEFVLAPDEPEPLVTIRAKRLFVVAGRVVDSAGRPLSGAQVDLGPPGYRPKFEETLNSLWTGRPMPLREPTRRDGTFRIPVAKHDHVAVYARKSGYLLAEGPVIEVGAADVEGVEITLVRGVTIEGRAPAHAIVTAVGRTGPFAASQWVQDGRYRIEGVPPGETLVTFRLAGGGTDLRRVAEAFVAGKDPGDPRAVVVTASGEAVECDLSGATPGRIEATFSDENGPSVGLDVTLNRLEGRKGAYADRMRTDQDGHVVFPNLDAGSYELMASRFVPVWVRVVKVAAGETKRVDARTGAGSFTATIVDDRTGQPIPGAVLDARLDADVDGTPLPYLPVAFGGRADARGFVEVKGLAEARYRFTVRAEGHEPSAKLVVTVHANETTTLDPIRLR